MHRGGESVHVRQQLLGAALGAADATQVRRFQGCRCLFRPQRSCANTVFTQDLKRLPASLIAKAGAGASRSMGSLKILNFSLDTRCCLALGCRVRLSLSLTRRLEDPLEISVSVEEACGKRNKDRGHFLPPDACDRSDNSFSATLRLF